MAGAGHEALAVSAVRRLLAYDDVLGDGGHRGVPPG
jgi:hypothetical protein